ncbi:MAG: hypothetical protein AB1422_00225 [bacterium]
MEKQKSFQQKRGDKNILSGENFNHNHCLRRYGKRILTVSVSSNGQVNLWGEQREIEEFLQICASNGLILNTSYLSPCG